MDTGLKDAALAPQTLEWLLDPDDPSPRYLTLTKLLGKSADSPAARTSRAAIPGAAPAGDILEAQYPQGYWMHPGIGTSPRYRATVWQILILAQLGMGRCGPLDRAVQHLFEANQRKDGAFRASKEPGDVPISLNASLLWALETLGHGERNEVRSAWSWLLEEVERRPRATDEGRRVALLGEVKVVWALNARLDRRKAQLLDDAPREEGCLEEARLDDVGLDDVCLEDAYLRGLRASLADSLLARPPTSGESDRHWFRLTFPQMEKADLLQWLTVLVDAGCGDDPRLAPARAWLAERRRPDATWLLESIPGKLWADVGAPGEPNKWITIRALAVDS